MKGLSHALCLDYEANDVQLEAIIKKYNKLLIDTGAKCGMQLMTSIWDHDTRDLHQIPEAVNFLKRFVRCGGLGILVLSSFMTTLPGYIPPKDPVGMGAIEVWAVANGKINGYKQDVDLSDFKVEYTKSLARYYDIV